MLKVNKTTDGKYAIIKREQVTRSVAIWSPIDDRRWDTEEAASFALMKYRLGIQEEPIKEQPATREKRAVTIDRSNLPPRSDLRITKLSKGVFVIERKKFGKWEEVRTEKTHTKAEEWCAIHSR